MSAMRIAYPANTGFCYQSDRQVLILNGSYGARTGVGGGGVQNEYILAGY
jgi:hypothetical protein